MRYLLLSVMITTLFVGGVWAATQDTVDTTRMEGGVKTSAFVDRKQVPLNRELVFTVKVEWRGDLSRYEIEELENPVLSNFDIVGTSSSNRVGDVDGQAVAVKEYEFTLRPSSLGMGYIEGVIIKYRDTATDDERRLITNRLEVEVIDPLPEPGQTRIPVLWIVLVLVVVAGGAAGFWTIRKRQEERRRREELEKVVPPEEMYMQELGDSFDVSSPQVDIKETSSGLSRLYRRYLADKYNIRALEATTDEVLSSMKTKELDERLLSETAEILKTCDIMKFAGGTGETAELQRVYTLIEDILQRNLRAPAEPTAQITKETDD